MESSTTYTKLSIYELFNLGLFRQRERDIESERKREEERSEVNTVIVSGMEMSALVRAFPEH